MISFVQLISYITEDLKLPTIGETIELKTLVEKINKDGDIKINFNSLKGYEDENSKFNKYVNDFLTRLFWSRANWAINLSNTQLRAENKEQLLNRLRLFFYELMRYYADSVDGLDQRFQIIEKLRNQLTNENEFNDQIIDSTDSASIVNKFPDAGSGPDLNHPDTKNKSTITLTKTLKTNRANKLVFLMEIEKKESEVWESFINAFDRFFSFGRF